LLDGLKGRPHREIIVSPATRLSRPPHRRCSPRGRPRDDAQGGTDIGNALALAREVSTTQTRLEGSSGHSAVRRRRPLRRHLRRVEKLDEIGARVLAVGIGSETGEPIPVLNSRKELVGYKKDQNGGTILTSSIAPA